MSIDCKPVKGFENKREMTGFGGFGNSRNGRVQHELKTTY